MLPSSTKTTLGACQEKDKNCETAMRPMNLFANDIEERRRCILLQFAQSPNRLAQLLIFVGHRRIFRSLTYDGVRVWLFGAAARIS